MTKQIDKKLETIIKYSLFVLFISGIISVIIMRVDLNKFQQDSDMLKNIKYRTS